jgi:ribA/ribD-fused uncharacterized protein
MTVNGIYVRSSEALYQSAKFPHLPHVQREIIAETNPMTSKRIAQKYRREVRSDWFEINVSVMKWAIRVKLVQNLKTFGMALIETGSSHIVESSSRDSFWGAIPSRDGRTLVGKNTLGVILTELRTAYYAGDQRLLSVSPPDVPDFLLYGEPVRTVEKK